MGVCLKLFCPPKIKVSSENKNNSNSKFQININVSPQSQFTELHNHQNINQINQNLNSSSINKSSDYFNTSNFPFTNKQSIKISNISGQIPHLKYSSSMSKGKLIRKTRTSKLNTKNYFTKDNSQFLFSNLKDKFICFFCGGKNCKYENYLTNKNKPNAIKGLNSNFITENVIAGQRPSDILIQEYNLLEQFKKYNIGLIINLEKEGEHPYCGPNAYNLNNSGYSYNPSTFSGNDIQVKFFSYKEINSELSINYILEIVKTISIFVYNKKQKVYVHCHSGNNRTGVIIACYLLYTNNEDVNDVIKFINEKRDTCLMKNREKKQILIFNDFIESSRIIYGRKEKIDVYIKRQEDILFGNDYEKFGYVPRIITKCLERILEIKLKYNLENLTIIKLLKGLNENWNNDLEKLLYVIKRSINKNDWSIFLVNENLIIFVELLFDFCEDCTFYVINPEKTDILINFAPFSKFVKQNNYFLTEQEKINILSFVRKVFFGYEYSIIFQIASFSALLFEHNINEIFNIFFNEMIDRFSMELQGYNLIDIQMNKNQIKSDIIENRISALSSIINLIKQEILNPNNYNNENNKLRIFLFPNNPVYPFFTIINGCKRNSKGISSLETVSHTNQRNSMLNFHDESLNDLLGIEKNVEEQQIKKIFVPENKKKKNSFIGNTISFLNKGKTKKNDISTLPISQSILLTFDKVIDNSIVCNSSKNKLKVPSDIKLKKEENSLINEIQNFKGRKSTNYTGIILK